MEQRERLCIWMLIKQSYFYVVKLLAIFVLMLIKETPRCMQKSIVDRAGKDQSQVSKAIDKLVEVGLVVKKEGRLIAQ